MNELISNKLRWIKYFLTVGMVMYHARWINYYNIEYSNVIDRKALSFYFRFAEHIGTVCMTFFFFVSAFWFYKGLNEQRDVLVKWKKRMRSLLVPFMLWTVILGAYKVYNSEIVLSMDKIFYYIFESPVAGPLWYILGLLILQCFAPLFIFFKKNKKITTILFLTLISYILLRDFNIIPHLLSFEDWWWYNNLIYYSPAYLIGAYLGLYYPDMLLKREYNSKSHTIVGMFLIAISAGLWYYYYDYRFLIVYASIELVGLWFVLKPHWFKKTIPSFISCEFYMYALHNPILVPKTRVFLTNLTEHLTLSGIEVLFFKIVQVLMIFVICCLVRFAICKFLPKAVDRHLTGGR